MLRVYTNYHCWLGCAPLPHNPLSFERSPPCIVPFILKIQAGWHSDPHKLRKNPNEMESNFSKVAAECLCSQVSTSCLSRRNEKELTSSPKCFMAYSNTPEAASGCCSLLLMLRKQKEDTVTLMHLRVRGLGTLGKMAHQQPEVDVSQTYLAPPRKPSLSNFI